MIPGSVCLETSDQRKIVNVMTVDHRSMWRRTQILTYILSHQWTWVTSRNATHRTPRSPSLSRNGPVAFFPPIILENFSSISQKVSPVGPSRTECQSHLLDHSSPRLFLYPLQLTEKKRSGIPGSTNAPVSWFMFFQVIKSSYILCTFFMWTGLMQTFIKICWHLMLRYKLLTLSTGHRRLQS